MLDDVKTGMELNLSALANEGGELYFQTGRLKKSRTGLTRADVIRTFETAFEMIGGVPRLAVWADTNPSEFFKLYGRLLPNSSSTELEGDQTIRIEHALPPPRLSKPDRLDIATLITKPDEGGA